MQGFDVNLPALIVAEISGNHGGSKRTALDLVQVAADCGADAVKFQTYLPSSLSIDCSAPDFVLPSDSPWARFGTAYNLYEHAHTPPDWLPDLFSKARKLGLIPFSSPFDLESVDYLTNLGVELFKVASPEINHLPLIEKIAATGRPVIFSLGVASRHDLGRAVETVRRLSNASVSVLQCETAYPADPANANLSLLTEVASEWEVGVGLSDHTLGHELVPAAVGAGAKIFEKHLVMADSDTVDSEFSASPEQFRTYVRMVRRTEELMGKPVFRGDEDIAYRQRNTRSIYASEDIAEGKVFTERNVRVVRPGFGLDPDELRNILGKKSIRKIPKGFPILSQDIDT